MTEGRNILRFYNRNYPLSTNINRTHNINEKFNFTLKRKMGLLKLKIILNEQYMPMHS